jgi:hypothetical protein
MDGKVPRFDMKLHSPPAAKLPAGDRIAQASRQRLSPAVAAMDAALEPLAAGVVRNVIGSYMYDPLEDARALIEALRPPIDASEAGLRHSCLAMLQELGRGAHPSRLQYTASWRAAYAYAVAVGGELQGLVEGVFRHDEAQWAREAVIQLASRGVHAARSDDGELRDAMASVAGAERLQAGQPGAPAAGAKVLPFLGERASVYLGAAIEDLETQLRYTVFSSKQREAGVEQALRQVVKTVGFARQSGNAGLLLETAIDACAELKAIVAEHEDLALLLSGAIVESRRRLSAVATCIELAGAASRADGKRAGI